MKQLGKTNKIWITLKNQFVVYYISKQKTSRKAPASKLYNKQKPMIFVFKSIYCLHYNIKK